MEIRRDVKSLLRGNWSASMTAFDDFEDLIATIAAGETAAGTEPAKTQPVAATPPPRSARTSRGHQRRVNAGSGRQFAGLGGAVDQLVDQVTNSRGELQVAGRTYRLSKPQDQADLIRGLQTSYLAKHQAEGLVQEIMCHRYQDTAPVCVSVNTDTHLPSFDAAHVEHWPESSYITRFFDTQANGKLTRIQLWKGHLLALNMTGAEISVWKPDTRWVLRCAKPFQCKLVPEEYFGPFWYPYMANELSITWDLVEKTSGRILLGFGKDSAYEPEAKWWAGKWIDHSPSLDATKMGEDYTIRYLVRDRDGIVAQGEGEW